MKVKSVVCRRPKAVNLTDSTLYNTHLQGNCVDNRVYCMAHSRSQGR